MDPPFADAITHDPDRIALLCGGCHDRVTRGLVSKNTVLKHLASPKSLEDGFSREAFDITESNRTVKFCGTEFINVRTIIAMMGREILSIHSPECAGAPMRISGLFCDSQGSEILRIVNNEWFSSASNWDVEVQGRKIVVRRAPNDIALVLRAEPPHTISIEKIAMYYEGARIVGREGSEIDAVAPSGARISYTIKRVDGLRAGIVVESEQVILGSNKNFTDITALGGAN